jgi:hypothetical protein
MSSVFISWFVASASLMAAVDAPVRLPQTDAPPSMGCWFWSAQEFEPQGYEDFLDLYAEHTGFDLLTTSIRHPVEVTDKAVHDQIKGAAEYARAKGMGIVMDLDVRLARQAFQDKYPDELQEIVALREVALKESEDVALSIASLTFGDHYTFKAAPYYTTSSRVLRVYSYELGEKGILPSTVEDITARCLVETADKEGVTVSIPCSEKDRGRTACVMAAFTLFSPAVFAPHLMAFEESIIQSYGDAPLAGVCKDEWGFPGRFKPPADELWFSRFMADAYAENCGGRDLVRDLLLMSKGWEGQESARASAINHYMDLCWRRNAALENAFSAATKATFGAKAVVATHPTWYPFPCAEEVFKNGLDWWACKRDIAQTDESTPFAIRTALAKKWNSPLWYNMYYAPSVEEYKQELWRSVLGGGRINFHPVWPSTLKKTTLSLLSGDLLRAEARVRMLNYISTAPVDSPVAVIFGHAAALNWTGEKLGDVGLAVSNACWEAGYYADIIPSSEIAAGHLTISEDGHVQYGPQRYSAAVLYHPQFERPAMADFFQAAAEGRTAVFRVGEWTMDFDGNAVDGNALLPTTMKATDEDTCVQALTAYLVKSRIEPQTPSTLRSHLGFPDSMVPKASGQCRLIDGTYVLAAGENNVMGDSIQRSIVANGYPVSFDAVGFAAVRLRPDGSVEAMAAGDLKSFKTEGMQIDLKERADVALWQNANGEWQGVVQGCAGAIPKALAEITNNWKRLRLPAQRSLGVPLEI